MNIVHGSIFTKVLMNFIVSNPPVKQLCLFNQVYLMIPSHKKHQSIYVNLQQVRTEWGVSGEGGREIKRAED